MNQYIYRGGKFLRCGYTTGSCAAAASKAAAICVLSGQKITDVELPTPKGITLTLDVLKPEFTADHAKCAVKKDSGDDPDVTNGVLVWGKTAIVPLGSKQYYVQNSTLKWGVNGTVTVDGKTYTLQNSTVV